MLTAAVMPWVIGLLGLAMLAAVWRLLRGPDAPDRILALDTLYVLVVALLVVLGIAAGTALLFEAALVIALLGFVSTVVLARFVERRGSGR